MARNFYQIFTENNPVMGDGKTFGIPEAKGLRGISIELCTKCFFLFFFSVSSFNAKIRKIA